jgi:Ca2+-transporting ATPase
MSADEVLRAHSTHREKGRSTSEVESLRNEHGANELQEAPAYPWWRRLLGQFQDLVILLLLVAAIVSGVLHEWSDSIAIIAIVVINGLIGFFQEERAQQALAALRKMARPAAKVIRDGTLASIPAKEIVPGDIVEIEAGDDIPADGRLLTSFNLNVQESALTGESVPVSKETEQPLKPDTALGDRANMAHMGTVVATGKGQLVVTAIGMKTELGRIAGLLQESEPEPTPLQRRLAELGRVLVIICLAIVVLVFLLQWFREGKLLESFMVSVGLAGPASDGSPQRADSQVARRRNAWLSERDLLGQNGNAYPQRDDGAGSRH